MPSIELKDALLIDTRRRAKARVKLFDTKCAGLYVSVSPTACTFSLKFWDQYKLPEAGQSTLPLGAFEPERNGTLMVRARAMKLLADAEKGVNIAAIHHGIVRQMDREERSFNAVADEYEQWCQKEIQHPDGGKRARKASWKHKVSFLKRPRAAFGKVAISKVTDDNIAALLDTIVEEGHTPLAQNVRVTLYSLFKWASKPGRKYVRANPCANLESLGERVARQVVMSPEHIGIFWRGLDRPDLPCDRRTALAFKLILTTMLRPGEITSAQRSEIELKGKRPQYVVPLERVKKRRVIVQPLNSLAVEVMEELMAMESKSGALFPAGARGAKMDRAALAWALRGRPRGRQHRGGQSAPVIGLCKFLGLPEYRPHDLRRSAATLLKRAALMGHELIDDAEIGRCLDHHNGKAPAATSIYVVAEQLAELKRPTLNKLGELLQEIIAAPKSNVVNLKAA